MTIFIDLEYKCHLNSDGTMEAVETDAFDGKCETFIEGYRFVPEGKVWVREDGEVFTGVMISPWKDYRLLAAVQEEYEKMQEESADMQEALAMLEVRANG